MSGSMELVEGSIILETAWRQKTCNYKDLPLRGTLWYIKYLTGKIYNNYNNVVLILNF